MGTSEIVQFWGAEFKNRWYTGDWRGIQPRFHVLSPHFYDNFFDACKKEKKHNKPR